MLMLRVSLSYFFLESYLEGHTQWMWFEMVDISSVGARLSPMVMTARGTFSFLHTQKEINISNSQ